MFVKHREDVGTPVVFKESKDDAVQFELKFELSKTTLKGVYNILERHTKSKDFDVYYGDSLLDSNDGNTTVLAFLQNGGANKRIINPALSFKYREVKLSAADAEVVITSNTTVYQYLIQLAKKKGLDVTNGIACHLDIMMPIELKTDYQFNAQEQEVKKEAVAPRTPGLKRNPSYSPGPNTGLQRRVSTPLNKTARIKHQFNDALVFDMQVEPEWEIDDKFKARFAAKLAEKEQISELFEIDRVNSHSQNTSFNARNQLQYAYKEITLVINGTPTKVRLDTKIWEIKMFQKTQEQWDELEGKVSKLQEAAVKEKAELGAQLQSLTSEKERLEKVVSEKDVKIEELVAQAEKLIQVQKALEESKAQVSQLQEAAGKNEKKIAGLTEELKNAKEANELAVKEKAELTAQLQSLTSEKEGLENAGSKKDAQIKQLEAQAEKLIQVQKALEESKAQVSQLQEADTNKGQEIERLKLRVQEATQANEAAVKEKEELESRLKERIEAYEQASASVDKQREEIQEKEKEIRQLEEELQSAKAAVLQDKPLITQEDLDALQLELKTAHQTIQNLEAQLAAKKSSEAPEKDIEQPGNAPKPEVVKPSVVTQFAAFTLVGGAWGVTAQYGFEKLATAGKLPEVISPEIAIAASVVVGLIAGSAALYAARNNTQAAAVA